MANTEFGIFNDEGCVEAGFFTREYAEAARVVRYADDDCRVAAICHDHEDQDAEHCEMCDAEDVEDDEDEE